MRQHLYALLLLLLLASGVRAQQSPASQDRYALLRAYPQFSDGIPIKSVVLLIHKDGRQYVADSAQVKLFYDATAIFPGTAFNQNVTNLAIRRIEADTRVKSASYELYNLNLSAPLILVVNIYMLAPGERKTLAGRSGMAVSGNMHDFPLIIQTPRSDLSLVLNGGTGIFNEVNAFFSEGKAFTEGSPIADDPAQKGVRFWGEAYLEPGLSGIIELGKSGIYAYGAATVLLSGRNTADIYSGGAAGYIAMEKLYAGVLFTNMFKKNNSLNLSYGRQNFQLNDGFLISKFSGSSNAGPRGSVYLNSRTAFNKVGLLKFNTLRWVLQGFYIEPQELSRHNTAHTTYAGAYLGYNDNKHVDVGLAYIDRVRSQRSYQTPEGTMSQKGLYVINPKLWISNIGPGLFFKSEYAFEGSSSGNMRANAWYAGLGIDLKKVKTSPLFFYRYAFMQGQKEGTDRYTRFDPVLTGGLADWVQGINMRKVAGNGNIISHRVQARLNLLKNLDVSVDYYHLRADSYINAGGLAPLTQLKSKRLGDEITLISHWYINRNFLLLGIGSWAHPGKGLRRAVPAPVNDWTSLQLALFMFFQS